MKTGDVGPIPTCPTLLVSQSVETQFNSLWKEGDLMATTTGTSKYGEVEALVKSLSQKVDQLRTKLTDAEDALDAATMTLNLLNQGVSDDPTLSQVAAEMEADYKALQREFKDLTQIQALVKIAQKSPTRRFRLTEARDKLIAVGLIRSRKNATNIIFNAIQRSEKFKRVAPGEYELIEQENKPLLVAS